MSVLVPLITIALSLAILVSNLWGRKKQRSLGQRLARHRWAQGLVLAAFFISLLLLIALYLAIALHIWPFFIKNVLIIWQPVSNVISYVISAALPLRKKEGHWPWEIARKPLRIVSPEHYRAWLSKAVEMVINSIPIGLFASSMTTMVVLLYPWRDDPAAHTAISVVLLGSLLTAGFLMLTSFLLDPPASGEEGEGKKIR